MEGQASFEGWAKVEIMGHQSHIGMVTTQSFGGTVMFRIDSPAIPEREETLTRGSWHEDTYCEPGSIVKREAILSSTVLVGAASVYRIMPCTEEVAIKAIVEGQHRPFSLVRLAPKALVEAADGRPVVLVDTYEGQRDDEEDEV